MIRESKLLEDLLDHPAVRDESVHCYENERPRIPVIRGLHAKILAALDAGGCLRMVDWHGEGKWRRRQLPYDDFCGTTHCYAGWVTHLAGDDGWRLEQAYRATPMAARLIIAASCPNMTEPPRFHEERRVALAYIKNAVEFDLPLGGRSNGEKGRESR